MFGFNNSTFYSDNKFIKFIKFSELINPININEIDNSTHNCDFDKLFESNNDNDELDSSNKLPITHTNEFTHILNIIGDIIKKESIDLFWCSKLNNISYDTYEKITNSLLNQNYIPSDTIKTESIYKINIISQKIEKITNDEKINIKFKDMKNKLKIIFEEIKNLDVDNICKKYISKIFEILKDNEKKIKLLPKNILVTLQNIFDDLIQSKGFPTITSDGIDIIINIPTIHSMKLFLDMNSSNTTTKKYVFVPFMFKFYNEDKYLVSLVFDIKEHKVYFIDTNGSTTYFDDILIKNLLKKDKIEQSELEEYSFLIISSEKLIEKLIENYLIDLNEICKYKFNYVKKHIHNHKNIKLNKYFKNTDASISLGTLLGHYLSGSNESVEEMWNKFGKLSDNEIKEIINGYSIGISNQF